MLADTENPEQEKKIGLMLRNSQRLLTLINQLLEISRFESGKIKLQAARQNIIPFLKGIAASFEPICTRNQLDLKFRTQEEHITLYFDPGKLEDVFLNLLANAVKFTPPGGQITVTASKSQAGEPAFPSGCVIVSICDTGPGIPREQLEHIFDRFYQSDSTYEHHRKGSGIGLTIAKELVELHRGRIDVHSHEGKGTEFIIRLPMGKGQLEPDEIVELSETDLERSGHIGDDKIGMMEISGAEPGEATIEQGIEPESLERNIILVVEDSADTRDYIKSSLEAEYRVVEAKDGKEGIQKAQEIIPDLIVSDIMMPGADGYELCRVLKNDVRTSHVPVVLLTARAEEQDILRGLETGADDYITKPFNTKMLGARIKNLIDLRSHLQKTQKRSMALQPVKMPVSIIDKEFFKKLQKVIEENISDPDFNVEEFCRKMDMSQPTLYRKIYALTGESPTDYIRSYRLKRGARLLKENFGTVLEVAFETGFSSANYFARCFKKKFHQSPSTFQAAESGLAAGK
jgi:CheY-like chemotaxis protein/two-component sensor histidine kinase